MYIYLSSTAQSFQKTGRSSCVESTRKLSIDKAAVDEMKLRFVAGANLACGNKKSVVDTQCRRCMKLAYYYIFLDHNICILGQSILTGRIEGCSEAVHHLTRA